MLQPKAGELRRKRGTEIHTENHRKLVQTRKRDTAARTMKILAAFDLASSRHSVLYSV